MSEPRPANTPSPPDRILHVLKSRAGHWIPTVDFMDFAGFRPVKRDPLTHRTAFHFHIEQLKRAVRADGFDLYEQNDHLMIRERVSP